MRNLYIYIISIIIIFLILVVYVYSLLDYGINIKTIGIYLIVFSIILLIGFIVLKLINKKIYDKDKNSG
jgi:hypothetical protein